MSTILVLHDGKPGHISQSLGLAKLIAERQSATIVLQKAKPRSGPAGRLARVACRAPLPGINILIRQLLYTLSDEQTEQGQPLKQGTPVPDLVISMGGQVVACNAASARYFGCPNIVIGDRKSVPKDAFSVNIRRKSTSRDLRVISSGITFCKTTAGPTAFDNAADDKTTSAPLSKSNQPGDNKRETWTLLLGGKGSGYRYDHSDIRNTFKWMKQQSTAYDVNWNLSTSRRTLLKHEQLLRKLIDQDADLKARIHRALWVQAGNRDAVVPIINEADKLFVTEDSLSMVNEAVATAKPVYTLIPKYNKMKSGHAKAMRYLCKQRLIQRISLDNPEEIRVLSPKLSYRAHVDNVMLALSRLGVFDGLYRSKRENKKLRAVPSNA